MTTAGLHELDTTEARELRRQLVSYLTETGEVRSERVRQALLRVPRHLFVPRGEPVEEAYANRPLPIGQGQAISEPAIVARMTESLELTGEERVLEIGTGSGYQAAVLSALAREVCSVEIFRDLAARSAARLKELGYSNVRVHHGDGRRGWPEHAPFDRVLATAAARTVPPPWLEQLEDGGILVAPVGPPDQQRLLRFRKHAGRATTEDLGSVAFVPILPSDRVQP